MGLCWVGDGAVRPEQHASIQARVVDARGHDVPHRLVGRDQPVGHDAAVTAPPERLRAHDGDALLLAFWDLAGAQAFDERVDAEGRMADGVDRQAFGHALNRPVAAALHPCERPRDRSCRSRSRTAGRRGWRGGGSPSSRNPACGLR